MKNRVLPIILGIAAFSLVILIVIGIVFVPRYIPASERSDLFQYYGVESADQAAIILNFKRTGALAKEIDGRWYLEHKFVRDNINQRFYWDGNENILRYTTATDVISVDAGSSIYRISQEPEDFGQTIVMLEGDKVYLAIDFVTRYTSAMTYEEFFDARLPRRIVIGNLWGGQTDYAETRRETPIREKGGIKSPVVADLPKGTEVVVIDALDHWSLVGTSDGLVGYVQNNQLTNQRTEIIDIVSPDADFVPLLRDKMISMGWHQVTSQAANNSIASVLASTKGMNVISPTWFYVNDDQGNLFSLASKSYVDYCHQQGVEVWGLFSNLENTEVDSTYVLTHTSVRDEMTRQIIGLALELGLDGINLDFEGLNIDVGDSFIQFVRELSIECKKHELVLSIDNYMPMPYNAFYQIKEQGVFADYIVLMGYDEHFAGSETAGSVSSIGFVKAGVSNTLQDVPANQVILGMPFYTRIWEVGPNDVVISNQAVGMQEAENRVSNNGGERIWSEADGQYIAEFTSEGKNFKVWLEDARSMEGRLKVMQENSLAGAAFWKLGLETSDIWDVIIQYI